MNAKPKRRYEGLATIPTEDGGALVIECEMVQPKSMIGRTVYVFLDREDVLDLLVDIRRAAINARQVTEAGRVDGR